MKQKKQNRILAALLAVVMMFQMLPMMAFAAEETAPAAGKAKIGETEYDSVKEAVEKAESGDTILLGEGNYTLYKVDSTNTTKGKNLTFVGQGTDKTAWNIGALVPDPANYGTEYNGDYSFDGAGTVTFQNMTLRSSTKDYLGFIRADKTVVENCVINGKTFYWGYTSAEFKNTTFNAPSGDYALWTYSSPIMTFDSCTFNATGKVINVYTDFGAGKNDITVNFNNCTVNSSSLFGLYKQALNINDSNMGSYKYILNISNSKVTAERDNTTCTQLFGFGGKAATNNTGRTDVNIDGKCVWKDGVMQTHDYTDGANEPNLTTTYAAWTENDGHYERKVTTTCNYCGYTTKGVEKGYKLVYDLNGGTKPDDAAADEYETKLRGTSDALAKAPVRVGYQFLGWKINEGSSVYSAGTKISEITDLPQTGDITLTAQWEEITTPGGGSSGDGGSGDGGAGAVVAGALLGGAGYLLGTRLWLESTFGFVPTNRIELAMALWKRADCPAPVSTELYPDIDEDDTDAQAAARWCVEQDLMKDFARTNSDGTQTVKFKPYDYVFRPQSLVKWYKLEKLLNEQQSTNA